MRVLIDRTSMEIFAADGAFSMLIPAKVGAGGVEVVVEGGTARVQELRVDELTSSWP